MCRTPRRGCSAIRAGRRKQAVAGLYLDRMPAALQVREALSRTGLALASTSVAYGH